MEERGHSSAPTILLSGDFNLGFLKSWDSDSLEALKAGATFPRDGRAVGEDKKQALHLVEFAEEFFLTQYVNEGTKKEQYFRSYLHQQ